jgi:vacuolar iron transporter family protein
VSLKAQTELVERELDIERDAIARRPDRERRELAAIYRSRGVDAAIADTMATQMMSTPDLALETHAREEMGVNPAELGSPLTASGASFGSFAVGAAIPLGPWLWARGNGALVASLVLAALAAVVVGASLARFTGRSTVASAARQVAIATVAAAITFGVGRLVGVG